MGTKINKAILLLCGAFLFSVFGSAALAGDHERGGNNACPVGLVAGLTLDEEFGPGASDLTHCIKRRHHVRVVVEINRACRSATADMDADGNCAGGPAALGNMVNMIKDYEITYGMKQGRDYEMVAVVHGSGGRLLLNNFKPNGYVSQVQSLMSQGVKFYFCQNTVRGFMHGGLIGAGDAVNEVIPGVQFVTAGFTALSDFQAQGWTQVTP